MDSKIYTKFLSKPLNYSEIELFFNNNIKTIKSQKSLGHLIFLEHEEIFTIGRFSKSKYHSTTSINGVNVIGSERGGDITYHGSGQLILYPIIPINILSIKPRDFVDVLLDSVVLSLIDYNLEPKKNISGPGIWIENFKIASIGLKFKKGFSTHGVSINLNIDLDKYEGINPCGEKNTKVGNLCNYLKIEKKELIEKLSSNFLLKIKEKSNYPKKKDISLSADSFESDP